MNISSAPSGVFRRCLADYGTSGGPIIALFYSVFPMGVTAIVTICYVGVWITIQVSSSIHY